MKRGVLLSLTLSILTLAGNAQDKPLRVHIIGASVSGGFRDGPMWGAKEQGDSVTLQQLLKPWADGEARVTMHNTVEMTTFFANPIEIGKNQIRTLKKARPAIVIALDFPFWFAYGGVGWDGERSRSKRLAQGLAMLADLEVPILLGDLPNMAGAAQRMLRPSWIPSPKLLKQLNVELRAWVAARPNVRLVELSTFVHEMRDVGIALPLEGGPVMTAKGALQQGDRLHATRLGMAYLGFALQGQLAAAFPAAHPLHQRQWGFEEFVDAAGADDELELLVEQAAASTSATGKER